MKYQEERLIDILLGLVENELNYEKEYNNCETEDYVGDLINAKIWLMRKKKLPCIIINSLLEEDMKEYLNK